MPPVVPGTWLRRTLLIALLLPAGCGDSVVLGGECRPLGASCPGTRHGRSNGDGDASERDASIDTQEPPDAGRPSADAAPPGEHDAAPPDAASPPDAGPPPLLGPFPPIENGSFDITAGPATGGSIGLGTQASPWSWCGGTVEVRTMDGDIVPSDGATFAKLSFSTGPGQLAQNLDTPLSAGTAYALAIDVAAGDGSSGAVLTIARGNGTCVPAGTLAVTPEIPGGMGWQTYCFVLTPTSDVSQIMLQASVTGGPIYVDNLREARGCTPEPPP